MGDIIEVEQDKDGVYKPKAIIKRPRNEVRTEAKKSDPINQLLDGFENGMQVIDRIENIIARFTNEDRQKK